MEWKRMRTSEYMCDRSAAVLGNCVSAVHTFTDKVTGYEVGAIGGLSFSHEQTLRVVKCKNYVVARLNFSDPCCHLLALRGRGRWSVGLFPALEPRSV